MNELIIIAGLMNIWMKKWMEGWMDVCIDRRMNE